MGLLTEKNRVLGINGRISLLIKLKWSFINLLNSWNLHPFNFVFGELNGIKENEFESNDLSDLKLKHSMIKMMIFEMWILHRPFERRIFTSNSFNTIQKKRTKLIWTAFLKTHQNWLQNATSAFLNCSQVSWEETIEETHLFLKVIWDDKCQIKLLQIWHPRPLLFSRR